VIRFIVGLLVLVGLVCFVIVSAFPRGSKDYSP
jgi:hypothetical protein